jgi:hypothetical protein
VEVFFGGLTTCAIGGLPAMLDKVVAYVATKSNSRGNAAAADLDVQLATTEVAVSTAIRSLLSAEILRVSASPYLAMS